MSRIDELKKQNPNLNITLMDIIKTVDPTTTYKYLPFLVKVVNRIFDTTTEGFVNALFEDDEIKIIKKFEEHCKANRIKNNDISKFETFEELEEEVTKAEELVKQKEAEKQVHKIYSDDNWTVLIPLSLNASQIYGSGTKWCIVQEKYWYEYLWNYKLIFVLDKIKNEKFAISVKYGTKILIQGWPADDIEVDPMMLPIPTDIFNIVLKEVRRPQYELELEVAGDHSVINARGEIVKYEDATREDVKFFVNTCSKAMEDDYKNRLKLLYENKVNGTKSIGLTFNPTGKGTSHLNPYGEYDGGDSQETATESGDDMLSLISRLRGNLPSRQVSTVQLGNSESGGHDESEDEVSSPNSYRSDINTI